MDIISKILTVGIIVCVAIASIGIAYSYTANTTNTENTAGSEFLIIAPSDGTDAVYSGSFSSSMTFNTRTVLTDKGALAEPRYVEEVIYELTDYTTISGHKYASLGQIYLTIDEQASDDDYKVSVIVDDGTGMNTTDFDFYVFFQIGSDDSQADAQTEAEADTGTLVAMTLSNGDMIAETSTIDNSASNTHTVVLATIYASLHGGDTYTKPLSTPIDSDVLTTVTFMFKATTV